MHVCICVNLCLCVYVHVCKENRKGEIELKERKIWQKRGRKKKQEKDVRKRHRDKKVPLNFLIKNAFFSFLF